MVTFVRSTELVCLTDFADPARDRSNHCALLVGCVSNRTAEVVASLRFRVGWLARCTWFVAGFDRRFRVLGNSRRGMTEIAKRCAVHCVAHAMRAEEGQRVAEKIGVLEGSLAILQQGIPASLQHNPS